MGFVFFVSDLYKLILAATYNKFTFTLGAILHYILKNLPKEN